MRSELTLGKEIASPIAYRAKQSRQVTDDLRFCGLDDLPLGLRKLGRSARKLIVAS